MCIYIYIYIYIIYIYIFINIFTLINSNFFLIDHSPDISIYNIQCMFIHNIYIYIYIIIIYIYVYTYAVYYI